MKDKDMIEVFMCALAMMVLLLIFGISRISDASGYQVLCGPDNCDQVE